jgi:HPt (histidine-containing phosphotransfer) domain-containing protein
VGSHLHYKTGSISRYEELGTAEKGSAMPFPSGGGSVSCCTRISPILSHACQQAVFGVFPQQRIGMENNIMMGETRKPAGQPGDPAASMPSRALDQELALSRMGGDLELLREIALLFLSDSARMLREIDQAVSARDAKALDNAAHTVKGCVSNFGAQGLYDASQALERMGRSGDLSNMERTYQVLRAEMAQLEADLRALTDQS